MDVFDGQLFGPGLPGAGTKVTAHWHADSLALALPDRELVAAGLTIEAGGFNAAGLRLSWRDEAGEYAFMIDTAAAKAACLAAAPALYAKRLAAAAGERQRLEGRFRLGGAALLLLLLLPMLALGAFFLLRDDLANWAVEHIPYEREAQLGGLVLAQLRLQMPLHEDGPAVEAVRAIGEQLTVGSAHHYRWLVADLPDLNAFAAPGGVVVVHAGLIRSADRAEELAGVLAHEVAHAELRHSLKAMVKGLGLRALLALALGDWSTTVMAEGVQHLTELRFSRDAEFEADREGLRRLIEAGIDPNGMVQFFEKLTRQQSLAPPAFLSTHPATEERLSELRRQLTALPGSWQPLAVDLAAAKAAFGGSAHP